MSDGDRGTERSVTLIVGIVLLAIGFLALFGGGRFIPWGGLPEFWRIGRNLAGPAGLILLGAAALYFSQHHGQVRAPERGKRLYRDESRKMISGVMAGLSDYLGIDVTVLRLAAVGIALLNLWGAVVAYIVAAVIVPPMPEDGATPPPPPGSGA